MKGFLNALGVIIGLGAILAAVAGVVYIVWLWWYGIVMGMASFGVPPIFTVIGMIVILALLRGLGALLLAVFGIYSGIWVLDWSWFWTLVLYATTMTVLFVGILAAGITAIVAGLVSVLDNSFGRH